MPPSLARVCRLGIIALIVYCRIDGSLADLIQRRVRNHHNYHPGTDADGGAGPITPGG